MDCSKVLLKADVRLGGGGFQGYTSAEALEEQMLFEASIARFCNGLMHEVLITSM